MKKFLTIAAATAALILSACGGSGSFQGSSASGGGAQTGNGGTSTPAPVYSLGKGSGSGFQAGAIDIAVTSLAAGGTTGMQVSIVDQNGTLYSGTSVTINFNSPCVAAGQANILPTGAGGSSTPSQVTTTTGIASVTYTAKGCAGPDVITATASVGSSTLTATGTVTVAAASVGSIQFQTASPASIGLKGTGLQETSTVVFKVVDSSGGARPGVTVSFALNTTVGGLSLAPATAVSAADGTVQTVVSAGTQHTSIRVTATIASPALSTQSSLLNVTTGLPAAAGFSLAIGAPSYAASGLACSNVEAYGQDGYSVPFTVRLSDRYNNPAPDGTAIAFNTNGGHIAGSCTTPSSPSSPGDGTCQVTWTSANPRPQLADDNPPLKEKGRAQILATTIGEESFTDTNGNGFWDAGEPFVPLGEPYRDDNENGVYDSGEYFLDFNQSGALDLPDTQNFKGITCTGTPPNATCGTKTLALGIEHLLIMSTSGAQISASTASVSLPVGGSTGVSFSVIDLNNNPMAAGTTISVSTTIGTVGGPGASFTIGCRSSYGPGAAEQLSFTVAAGGTPGPGTITIAVTSPGTHTVTMLYIPITVT